MEMKRIIAVMLGCLTLTFLPFWQAPSAAAGPVPGCQDDFWWTLQATRRLICDGTLRADGGWLRLRVFYTPAHRVPQTTHCYGRYSVTCTTTGGYDVAYSESANEVYPVMPDTVLPDEPGYLGDATANLHPQVAEDGLYQKPVTLR